MIRRVERPEILPPRRLGIQRRPSGLRPVLEDRGVPELALRYSNGFVTVEITHDAVDAYVDEHGDVPLPIEVDPETGDRRTFDARTRVRVVYDRLARLREITTRGRDGLYVRLTVLPDAGTDAGSHDALGHVADEERDDADGDRLPDAQAHDDGEPPDTGDEDDAGAEKDGYDAPWITAARPAFVQ